MGSVFIAAQVKIFDDFFFFLGLILGTKDYSDLCCIISKYLEEIQNIHSVFIFNLCLLRSESLLCMDF